MRLLPPLFFPLVLAVTSLGAAAQDRPEDGIVVTGRAEVALVPNRAVVTLLVSCTAKTSKLALVDFEKKRKKLVDALAKLQGGSIKAGPPRPVLGPKVEMEAMMMGNAPPENPDMEAREELEVQVAATGEAKDLAALVSEVVDVGVANECSPANGSSQIQMMMWTGEFDSQPGAIRYICDDVAELEQKALARAVEDAAAQAGAVARIAGLGLGRIQALDASGARVPTEFDSPTPGPQKIQIVVRYCIQ